MYLVYRKNLIFLLGHFRGATKQYGSFDDEIRGLSSDGKRTDTEKLLVTSVGPVDG